MEAVSAVLDQFRTHRITGALFAGTGGCLLVGLQLAGWSHPVVIVLFGLAAWCFIAATFAFRWLSTLVAASGLIAVLLVVVALSISLNVGRATPLTETERIPFIVPTGSGDSGGVAIDRFGKGHCFVNWSIDDQYRVGAMHCVDEPSRNAFDPCFARPGYSSLLCFYSGPFRFVSNGTKLTPAALFELQHRSILAGYVIPSPDGWERPWALEVGRMWCLVRVFPLDGISDLSEQKYKCFWAAGESERFHPNEERFLGWLTEYPNETEKVWTVPFVARSGEGQQQELKVAKAWR